MDWYAATFSVTIFALLEVLVMTYIYGKNDMTFCINNKNLNNIFFSRPESRFKRKNMAIFRSLTVAGGENQRNAYKNRTVHQCWLIGQFWLVLYSKSIISVLRKRLAIGQFSFSLCFIGHYAGSKFTRTYLNGTNHRFRTDCTGHAYLQYTIRQII